MSYFASPLKLSLLLVFCLASAGAHASRMYRCGNTFQDRPCDNAEASKVVGQTGTTSSAPASSAKSDRRCQQRGEDAQKIRWEKEAGKTLEAQQGTIADPAQRQFIADIYKRTGSATQVRKAIEAECAAEQERAAQAAALEAAAAKLAPPAKATPTAPSSAPSTPAPRTSGISQSSTDKKADCSQYKQAQEKLQALQRQGGDVATTEMWRDQLRDLDKQASAAGCK